MEMNSETQPAQAEASSHVPPWPVPGFRAAGVHAGLKRRRRDMALMVADRPVIVVGAFTTNRVQGAPVHWTRRLVEAGQTVRAIVCNSGNANACNGPQGEQDAAEMAAATAAALGLEPSQVLVASTGVIGLPMDMAKIRAGIGQLARELTAEPTGWGAAAEAIMTTDTRPKCVAHVQQIRGRPVHVLGIAKGSGMIHPNLATMLAFLVTDAQVERERLQQLWRGVVRRTFNQVSIDGDTSTNDMALLLAGDASGVYLAADDPAVTELEEALTQVARSLARQIAGDGEGASRLLEVQVIGAADDEQARQVARAVVRSNLVKAAVFGQDANWGRILCAAGYSGVPINPDRVNIWIGPIQVCQCGQGLPFDEAQASSVLAGPEVPVQLDLQEGKGSGVAWGCDLTYDYVKINANYRT